MTTEKSFSKIPFVDLATQYASIASEVNPAIQSVIESCAFILGPEVKKFEEEFAAFCDVQYAISVDSGTAAIELALRAFDIGPGDEVIAPANTFIATVLPITQLGAKPVLVDHHPETYTIDVEKIEAAITDKTRVIIPVHLYGQPADMDAIMDIARRHNLIVIEDACQAHGTRYKGRRVGGIGDAAAFSFYPGKNLGAYGDGGMVVTNNAQTADRLMMLRNYGQRKKYLHEQIGYNHRLDSVQAAVLRVKLKYLDGWNEARRQHAGLYSSLLADLGVHPPVVPEYSEPVWHLYVIRVEDRDGFQAFLAEHKIDTGIHYPIPIHLQPAYQSLGYKPGDFPVTEAYADKLVSLPMYAELTDEMISYVVSVTRDFLKR